MADHQRSGRGGGSRDLLRHFASARGVGGDESPAGDDDDSGDIELSLGLSLGGSFGVDPSRAANRLVRSSSSNLAYALAPSLSAARNGGGDDEEEEERRRRQALVRTCSLPVPADEDDDRKRRAGLLLGRPENKRRKEGGEPWGITTPTPTPASAPPPAPAAAGPWGAVPPPSPPANTSHNEGEDADLPNFIGRKTAGVISFRTTAQGQPQGQPQPQPQGQQKPHHLQSLPHQTQTPPRHILAQPPSQPSRTATVPLLASQGSLGSQGSSLTAATLDSESRPPPSTQGHNQPPTNQNTEQAASIFQGPSMASNSSGYAGNPAGSSRSNGSLETDRAIGDQMPRAIGDQMPSVFTKGDGPNGRIIEGFLYKYKKVEEVRIVCVCHGIFLTPAEFIKHAGGSDVAHPLRHIVVKPPSTPSTSFL